MQVWLDLLRRMPAGEKIEAALRASELVLKIADAGVRMAYPDAGDREVFLRAASRRLSRDLMIRAYGWDPKLHEHSGRRV